VANYLKIMKRQLVIALLELGWTYRRIESETGVRRETVSKYDDLRRSNPAKVFPGSTGSDPPTESASDSNPAKVFPGSKALPPRFAAAEHRDTIVTKLDAGLTAQRIWQDLVEDYGYAHSYESVKRYVRRLAKRRRSVGVYHSAPGEEAQVDFFRGAPTFHTETGQWRRPWVFRMTLCHSRHGYEEAVWDQKIETFLRCHENAFREFGGVVRVVRHDNLKAAVVRACLYDPDANEIYTAFSRHWGFTALPTRPRTPEENGKQERSGGYVKSNALKDRRFECLAEQNEHLRRWNRTVARLRIHGTTRRQVIAHFLESEKPALLPLAAESFPFFQSGSRTVHPDGMVEVAGSFYPAPAHLLHETVRMQWDQHLVRLFHKNDLVSVFHRLAPGHFHPRPGGSPYEVTSTQRAFAEKLLAHAERIGPELRRWAEAAIEERGVRAYRLIQGVLSLVRTHPRERVLWAAGRAAEHQLFRYRDLRRLVETAAEPAEERVLLTEHDAIRPMTHYRLEDLL